MVDKYLIIVGLSVILIIVGIPAVLYWVLFLATFVFGFVIHLIFHRENWRRSNPFYDRIRTRFSPSKLFSSITAFESAWASLSKSSYQSAEPAALTGISEIDEPLRELIDLFVRDHVEIWYKNQISSEESFINEVKIGIHTMIRHLSERLREIDWLDFCTGTLVDSFATHIRLYRKAKERIRLEQSNDIRSCFFDLEADYERGICRDDVCMDKDKERDFLRDIVDVLLYILLPANEFRCVPARVLLREVSVNFGLIPFIDMYSDPDTMNQLVISMCRQIPLTIENFLLVVRTTDSQAELETLTERLDVEINRWRSKDTGGENDADVRATLNSYYYLKNVLKVRFDAQTRVEPSILDDDDNLSKVSYRDLSLTEILNNGNGLEHFLKFLQTMEASGYGSFYLNSEAFRCFCITLSERHANPTPQERQADQEKLRNTAKNLIEHYFLPTGILKLEMDENLIAKTLQVIDNGTIDETLFDELQTKVFNLLSSDKYYGAFKTTPQYLRTLSECDFTDSLNDNSDTVSLSSTNSNETFGDSTESQQQSSPEVSTESTTGTTSDPLDNIDNYSISAEIKDSGLCCEKGERYAIYVISVICKPLQPNSNDQWREWFTYRRFSEFNDLHMTIRKRYPSLKEFIRLPTKNFMNNTSAEVRNKRQKELNDYLAQLTNQRVLQNNPGLRDLILKFLRNQQWKNEQTELAHKIDTLANPFKQASAGIAKGVSKISGGLTIVSDTVLDNTAKIFRSNSVGNNNRANRSPYDNHHLFPIAEDGQDDNTKNIPLRVLLVIMDEVFDLKQKNMWFRSRFVSILKGFLRTFMGDSVNRRIATFIQHWTSAKKVAKEIRRFKENFWPNGVKADRKPEQDRDVRNINQIICRAKLLGIVSDELRHIVGSETTRRGLLRLFELLQNETLNRRFVYIVIEALLIKLFQPNDLQLVLEKLYSQSVRVKEEYRRRIFEQTNSNNGVLAANQHYGESKPRPYYLNRLSVRNDDSVHFQGSNSGQPLPMLSRSLSKISR